MYIISNYSLFCLKIYNTSTYLHITLYFNCLKNYLNNRKYIYIYICIYLTNTNNVYKIINLYYKLLLFLNSTQ